MTAVEDENFAFVLQDPQKKFSRQTRTLIRKRAMRAVGETVRNANRASVQFRNFEAPKEATRDRKTKKPSLSHHVSLPKAGFASMAAKSGLHPLDLDLSALTCVHIGTLAAPLLSSEPDRLRGLLTCRQKSYFSYILPRLGHVPVLDDAFCCLIAAAQCMLLPSRSSRDVLFIHYGKALRSLQTAVDDPKTRCDTEVLCATAILAMFEMLSSSDGRMWSEHIAGASRLIEFRGPSNFNTDFDRLLLLSLSYPVCTQAMLRNEPCFLDDPRWTEVLMDSATPGATFSDQSSLALEMITIKYKIPEVVKRTNHAVIIQDAGSPALEALVSDLRDVRSSIIAWRRKFNAALITMEDRPRSGSEDYAKRYELLGISLIVNIMASRMLVAVDHEGRPYLEEEVQNCAHELRTMKDAAAVNERAAFFLELKGAFGDAAITTHQDFDEVRDSGTIVEAWRLERFFDLLGRQTCDGKTCCKT